MRAGTGQRPPPLRAPALHPATCRQLNFFLSSFSVKNTVLRVRVDVTGKIPFYCFATNPAVPPLLISILCPVAVSLSTSVYGGRRRQLLACCSLLLLTAEQRIWRAWLVVCFLLFHGGEAVMLYLPRRWAA